MHVTGLHPQSYQCFLYLLSPLLTHQPTHPLTLLLYCPWPGNEPHNVGSGIGYVHNSYLFDHLQKGVLYAPWTYSPQPLWSVGQLGLAGALPWAFKYMCSQHNPPLALVYLVRLAIVALRHSWRPAAAAAGQAGGQAVAKQEKLRVQKQQQ
jgi:hypothetical protein